MFCTPFSFEIVLHHQRMISKSLPFNFVDISFVSLKVYVAPRLLNRLLCVILYKVNERWLTAETVNVYLNICANNVFAC